MNLIKTIACSSTSMRSKPNENAAKISEALFGEPFQVFKNENKWCYGKLLSDGYSGWIIETKLCNKIKNTHKVSTPSTVLKMEPNVKSKTLDFLYLGSQLKIISINSEWASLLLPSTYSNEICYISKNHIKKMSYKNSDWVCLAEKFIGTPYVWGGRCYKGLDCSALVQICLQSASIYCPRDSILQFNYFKEEILDFSTLHRGTLIYWSGHVAIVTSETCVLHSNSFHMSVFKEPLELIMNRMIKANIRLLGTRSPSATFN